MIKHNQLNYIVTEDEAKAVRESLTFTDRNMLMKTALIKNKYFIGLEYMDDDRLARIFTAPTGFWDRPKAEQEFIIPDIIEGRME